MKKIVSERYSNSLSVTLKYPLKATQDGSTRQTRAASRSERRTRLAAPEQAQTSLESREGAATRTIAPPALSSREGSATRTIAPLPDLPPAHHVSAPWEAAVPLAQLGCLTLPRAQNGVQAMAARLDRCLSQPHLHIIDASPPRSYPVQPASVAGLADGAPVLLSPCETLPASVVYQLGAPDAAFALSMVGRVVQGEGHQLWVEALQPHGPFRRLRLEAFTEAHPGELVVASVDAPQGKIARVVGRLQDPQAAITGICAIAADCGARFGHSPEVTGHAWNIRQDQVTRGPGMFDVPFFTLDPKGTRVIDQAMHIERSPDGGYLLHYAIADGGALVPKDSLCDKSAQDRGSAIYLQAGMPDELKSALQLLPDSITEDAGSLVEEKNRPAWVVTLRLDPQCEILDCTAKRTLIHSLQQVTTQQVQWYYDHNMSSKLVAQPFAPSLSLLREVGQKLVQRAKHRGATTVSHNETPAKPDLVANVDGGVRAFEMRDVEVSQYNGQISMLVNEAVASLLAKAGVRAPFLGGIGIGRDDGRLRAQVAALGFAWPMGLSADEYLASLPTADTRTVAIRHLLLAQSPATAFSAQPVPHAALGLPAYLNATAPLRRYQDMVVQRITEAVITGMQPIPYQDDASIAAVVASANIGRERQRLITQRTHGVRAAAFLREHIGSTLAAKVISVAGNTAVVELEASKIRLPLSLDPHAKAVRVHDLGAVQVFGADVITRQIEIAWTHEVPAIEASTQPSVA